MLYVIAILLVGVMALLYVVWQTATVIRDALGTAVVLLGALLQTTQEVEQAKASRVAALLETRGVGRAMLQERIAQRAKAGRV